MNNAPRADVSNAIRACRLWHSASEASLDRLVASAVAQDVARGGILAVEGEPADRIGVIVAGKVRVFHASADGKTIVLDTLGSPQPLAAVAALAGARHPASATATTPATVAWIPKATLFAVVEREPTIARTLIADLAQRVIGLTGVVQSLALDVPARLARYLFQRSLAAGEASPDGLVVPLGMTKAELALSLGTVPETLSRALARLRADGILEVRGRAVVVRDVGALARLGSGYDG